MFLTVEKTKKAKVFRYKNIMQMINFLTYHKVKKKNRCIIDIANSNIFLSKQGRVKDTIKCCIICENINKKRRK